MSGKRGSLRGALANLLLVAGTVLGAIAAANSAKASRRLELSEDAYPGEHVARDVHAPKASESDGEVAPLVRSGAELSAGVVSALRAAGFDEVVVRDPPVDHEILSVEDRAALEGRILAKSVKLREEVNEIPEGRRVTGVLLARCAAAGLPALEVKIGGERTTLPTAAEKAPDGLAADEAQERQAEFDEAFAKILDSKAKGARVAGTFTMREDVLVKAGAFLDAPTIDQLEAAGVRAVDVRIVKRFRFGGWDQRWLYLLALVAMISGVALKRAVTTGDDAAEGGDAPAGALGAAEVRRRIGALADKLADLASRVDDMEAAAIHAAVDPLLAVDVYAIVESRGAVAAKLGPTGFVAVFGPFASAERQMNRAWSAAVDGNAEEARDSVRRAADGLVETVQAYPRT